MDASHSTSYDKICIVKRFKIEITFDNFLRKFSVLSVNNDLKRYMCDMPACDQHRNISCIYMLGHPLDPADGKMDTKTRIGVVCIGVPYTIYRQKIEEDEDDIVTETKKIAAQNCYDYDKNQFTLHDIVPMVFYSYDKAQEYIADHPEFTFYNNKHDILHEVAFNSTCRFDCVTCGKKTNMKCMPCGNVYMCVECHEHSELKGDAIKTINQAKILRINELEPLKRIKMYGQTGFVVSKPSNIDREICVSTPFNELPWDDEPTDVIKIDKKHSIKVY